jgi:hypothetical protein
MTAASDGCKRSFAFNPVPQRERFKWYHSILIRSPTLARPKAEFSGFDQTGRFAPLNDQVGTRRCARPENAAPCMNGRFKEARWQRRTDAMVKVF